MEPIAEYILYIQHGYQVNPNLIDRPSWATGPPSPTHLLLKERIFEYDVRE